MKNLNVLDKLQPLFVQGENIAQTYQFIRTSNADLGFIALSQVIGKDGKITEGSGWIVPEQFTPTHYARCGFTEKRGGKSGGACFDDVSKITGSASNHPQIRLQHYRTTLKPC